jgi:phosphoglycerate dehydrogenase-like enzyme
VENVLAGPLADHVDGVPGVEWDYLPTYSPEVTPEQINGFDAVITGWPLWTEETFANSERLSGVLYWGVGYNDVDIVAATKRDVIVAITTPAVRRPMAESILTYLLALSKNLFLKDLLAREGRADEAAQHNGILLRNRVIGAIGVGNIGADVVRLLKPFEPKTILAFDPYVSTQQAAELGVELADMDTLLGGADFVVVMCPLNDETRHMIGDAQFDRMRPTAYFINASRGAIVDQPALVRALEGGKIRGAALDVFETEPPPPEDPILKFPNVIATPHCIGWTEELYYDNGAEDCRAALAIAAGTAPAYVVNPDLL